MSCLPPVIPDQIKSARVTYSATQKSIIIPTAVGDVDAAEYLTLPTAITDAGLVIGAPCPVDSNCLLNTITSEALGGTAPNAGFVLANYIGFDYYSSVIQASGGTYIGDGTNLSFSYASALNQDQANTNYGQPAVPNFVYWWDQLANVADKVHWTSRQVATCNVLKPYTTLTVSYFYTVSGFPDANLEGLSGIVGFANDAAWQNGDIYTWLCMGVTAQPVGLAQQLKVDIQFMYLPQTWRAWAFTHNDANGLPPSPALKNPLDPDQNLAPPGVGSNGAAGFLVYGTQTFATVFGF